MTQTAGDAPAGGTTKVPAQAGSTAGAPGAVPGADSAAASTATPTAASAAEPAAGASPASGPLARLLAWRTPPAVLTWTCFAAFVANIGIIVTGGAVRLTDSGLGCPTWPTCTDGSLVPTSRLGAYGVVEFTNRMLTFAVSVAVGAAIIACMRWHPRRAVLNKLSWTLFVGVVVQAVIGGISVRTHLAPIWVSVHMLVSLGMVALSYVLWVRSREPNDDDPTATVQPILRRLGYLLTAGVGALLIAGTIVTGSGPHSGAKAGDPGHKRFPLSPANATQLHADLVFLVVGLTVALWFGLKATGAGPRVLTTVRDLFLLLMAQGVIGYVQYFTHLPVLLVGIHMFGAAIVWAATWRVLLAMRERKAGTAAESQGRPVPA
ncbi:COX15/CtaA family protein [Catenulispora sp. NF23]|uniref:COX15/CtaA family protein n=1 Tax=Catenulispora pinistramenti TaxID=2705254 RepID=A0ABS5KY61_9ACTN|nr:COX15/CtaA family protein [Catenulispora pinistramenti]MBS2534492.1 COX15/CtaA family protein [Catenulispora pinistramenti]MBS2550996.1 COX15/CtaA family protein [Catenulispora pinistramenti]